MTTEMGGTAAAIVTCSQCDAELAPGVAFCTACGHEQYAHRVERRRQERLRQRLRWDDLKSVIVFYVVYLTTIVPLAWIPEQDQAAGQIVVGWFDALVIIGFALQWRARLRPMLEPRAGQFAALPLVAVLLAGLLAINLGYHHLLLSILPEIEITTLTEPFIEAGFGTWVQYLTIAVMPGIWEEIAFRGLIQERLRQVISPREALVLTAVLFAIIHCSFWSTPVLFLIGLALGWLRDRTGSLLPGMLLHGCHNAVIIWLE